MKTSIDTTEHRPTTVGELRQILDDLNLPDETPLVTNLTCPPNGNYVGYAIMVARSVREVKVPDDHRHFSKAKDGDIVALYIS